MSCGTPDPSPSVSPRGGGPKGCKLRVVKVDLRPGGVFHYAMTYQPGHEMWGRFVYREVAAPERLVYVSSFSDEAAGAHPGAVQGVIPPPDPKHADAPPRRTARPP